MRKTLTAMLMGAMIAGSATAATAASLSEKDIQMDVVGQLGMHFDERPGTADNFDLNRLRIKLGAQPADNIKFVANLELAENGGAGSSFGDNTPTNAVLRDLGAENRIADMYVVLTYLDWVTILAGQMPTPVSYELNTDVYDLETVQYSQFVGIANRDRGVGFVIPIPNANTDFTTWVLNGTGGVIGAQDDFDDRYNYGGMLNFKPMENLSFKVFTQFANMSDDTGVQFAGLGANTAGRMAEFDADAFGAGMDYKNNGFHLFGEYVAVKSKLDETVPATGVKTRLLSQKTREWYVNGSYAIPETDVQLVARYDKYDPNTGAASDEQKIFTAGLNWNFEKDARLQIMREFNSGLVDQDELDIQLSVRF